MTWRRGGEGKVASSGVVRLVSVRLKTLCMQHGQVVGLKGEMSALRSKVREVEEEKEHVDATMRNLQLVISANESGVCRCTLRLYTYHPLV